MQMTSTRLAVSRTIVALLVLLFAGSGGGSAARADVDDFPSEFAFTLNWVNLTPDLEADGFGFDVDLEDFSALDDADGLRAELRYTRPLFGSDRLRIGSGIGVTWYEEDGRDDAPLGISADEELLLITPELQLSWRQPLGERWFVEGGLAVGAVIANYQADDVVVSGFDVGDVDEWAVGYGLRPFLRVGHAWDRLLVGAEVSYRWTDIEFDDDDVDIDGELDEVMAGVFVGVRF